MAGIYIPNAELPSGIDKLIISADGQVYFVDYINPYRVLPEKAIPVPDHGRLIDMDEVCNRLLTLWDTADKEKKVLISAVLADVVTPIVVGTPTIIPVDKEGAK